MPLPRLPCRDADSHKGTFGKALVVGGSRGMAGAIALSGISALRGGAGLVQVAVPHSILATVASFEPSYMTTPLPESAAGRLGRSARARIEHLAKSATAVALGPGLGRSPDTARLVVELWSRVSLPMVVDADALNALALHIETLPPAPAPRILTPHPGEFQRLTGAKGGPNDNDARLAADQLARRLHSVVLLKGARSYITDGDQSTHNATGNPGMATGGTGDVLTGLVVALLCQGLIPYDAAVLGAHLHGLAGNLAARDLSQPALIASDLPRYFGQAFAAL